MSATRAHQRRNDARYTVRKLIAENPLNPRARWSFLMRVRAAVNIEDDDTQINVLREIRDDVKTHLAVYQST